MADHPTPTPDDAVNLPALIPALKERLSRILDDHIAKVQEKLNTSSAQADNSPAARNDAQQLVFLYAAKEIVAFRDEQKLMGLAQKINGILRNYDAPRSHARRDKQLMQAYDGLAKEFPELLNAYQKAFDGITTDSRLKLFFQSHLNGNLLTPSFPTPNMGHKRRGGMATILTALVGAALSGAQIHNIDRALPEPASAVVLRTALEQKKPERDHAAQRLSDAGVNPDLSAENRASRIKSMAESRDLMLSPEAREALQTLNKVVTDFENKKADLPGINPHKAMLLGVQGMITLALLGIAGMEFYQTRKPRHADTKEFERLNGERIRLAKSSIKLMQAVLDEGQALPNRGAAQR